MKQRGWEFMGHRLTNSQALAGMSLQREQGLIHTTLEIIEHIAGRPVRGWLGTGLAETISTLDVLAKAGVRYTGDWIWPIMLRPATAEPSSLKLLTPLVASWFRVTTLTEIGTSS